MMMNTQSRKIQSVSDETEKVLIGACLRFPENNIPIILDRLEPEDFSSPRNRDIFSAIKALYGRDAPIDLLSVPNELKAQRKVISASEVVQIHDDFIDGLNLDYHINGLKTLSKRRRLSEILRTALLRMEDLSVEYPEIEDCIVQEITGIVNEGSVVTRKRSGIDLTLTTLQEVFQFEKPRYLIEPVLTEGAVNLFGGGAGKGKSIVTLSIIKSTLTGEPLWGKYPVMATGPVLLVDEETPRSFLRHRIEQMGFDKNLPLYVLHFQDVRLDLEGCFNALMAKIQEVNPLLVVIDSLIRVHHQKENEASMSLVMGQLRKIANLGITVWVIHHHKKGDGPLTQMARGSSDIVAGVDVEYGIVVKDGFLNFSSVKTRVEPFGPIRLRLEAADDRIDVVYGGTERENVLQEVEEILSVNERLGVDEIHGELKNHGVEVGINRLREILRSAKNLAQEIVRTGRSRRFIYSLKDSITTVNDASRFTPL